MSKFGLFRLLKMIKILKKYKLKLIIKFNLQLFSKINYLP